MFKKRARPAEGLRSGATSAEGDGAEEAVVVPAAAVRLSGIVSSNSKAKSSDSVVMSFESSRTAVSAVTSLVDLAAENEEIEEDRAREAREALARAEAAKRRVPRIRSEARENRQKSLCIRAHPRPDIYQNVFGV